VSHESLARKLRVLRAERGWTLREVFEKSGVDKVTLSFAERGLRKPYSTTLAKLAEVYDVSLKELLDAADERAEAPDSEASEELSPVPLPKAPRIDWGQRDVDADVAAMRFFTRNVMDEASRLRAEFTAIQRTRGTDRLAWLCWKSIKLHNALHKDMRERWGDPFESPTNAPDSVREAYTELFDAVDRNLGDVVGEIVQDYNSSPAAERVIEMFRETG